MTVMISVAAAWTIIFNGLLKMQFTIEDERSQKMGNIVTRIGTPREYS